MAAKDAVEINREIHISDTNSVLVGGGEMGDRIRAFDWSESGLGNLCVWPQVLKTIVNMMLQSPVPMVLLWGPDGIMIYNDAYAVFAGERHPFLLGSKVVEGWPEVADFNRNVMAKCLNGESLSYKDQQLTLYRNNVAEEVWMDLNYSPIMDEDGKPAGVLAIVVETSKQVLAEKALRDSESRFRTMADSAPVMIWMTNATGEQSYRNKAFANFYGLPEASDEAFDWENYVHPEDVEYVKEVFYRAAENKSPFHLSEHRLRRHDGEYRWLISNGVPRLAPTGDLEGYVGTVLDITERKQVELSLEDSNQRFRAAVDAVQGILWTNNAEGQMTGEQPGWATLTGQTYEEYQGYGWAKAVHPEDAEPTINAWHEAVGERRTFVFEHRVRRHDGDWRHFSIRAIPVLAADGTIREWVGVHTDITEIKQAVSELAESEERFRFLADASPAMIWMVDPTGQLTYYNKALRDFTGYTQDDVFLKSWEPVIHPDDFPWVSEQFLGCITEQHPFEAEFRTRRYDGEYQWLLSSGSPRYTPSGEFIGFVGSGFNIHDRKQAEESLKDYAYRLERSNRELEQFATIASHDLQEPLRKVTVFGEMLKPLVLEEGKEYLGRMTAATQRMQTLIDDLLTLSRVHRKGKPFTQIDLNKVATTALDDLQIAIREADAIVIIEPLGTVNADESSHWYSPS